MRFLQLRDRAGAAEVLGAGRENFEELISESRVDIFALALDLIGDSTAAEEVVEEVFLRISKELNKTPRAELEQRLHRYTYDAALGRLVERIETCVERIDECAGEIAGIPFAAPRTIS